MKLDNKPALGPGPTRQRGSVRSKVTSTTVVTVTGFFVLLFCILIANYFNIIHIGVQQPAMPGQPTPEPSVGEELPIQFYVHDQFAGGAVASATVTTYRGLVSIDSLTTTSSGIANTSKLYAPGDSLNVKVVKSSAYQWFKITVPPITAADRERGYNYVELPFWTYNAPSITVMDSDGNTYSSGSSLNKTSLGKEIVSLTITVRQTTDNRGYRSSYDPINDMDWFAAVYVKLTGTNYENIVLTGSDHFAEKGTNMWHFFRLPDDGITRWKVGNEYKLSGEHAVPFTLDLSGYSGDAADLVIEVYYYTDWDYFAAKGSKGPDAVEVVSDHTLNLVD